MLNSFFRKVGNYLAGFSDNERPPETPHGHEKHRNLIAQAQRIASSRRSQGGKLLAGSIQFLNLEQIKRELGGNWGRTSRVAYNIVEQTLSKKLSVEDSYAKHSDEMFVLCFGSTDRQVVEARMGEIVEEIKQSLSRSGGEAFRIAHDVADIAFVDAAEDTILDTIANSLRQVRKEAETAASVWREHLLRNAGIRYKPVWLPQKKLVAIHRAVLDDETGRRTMQRLSSLTSADDMLAVLFELDCLILGRAASGLHDLISNGGQTQLIVPVNFNSMNIPARRKRYLKLCEDIPTAYRRFLLFEIGNIPAGTPGGRIMELAVSLKAYAHGILIESSPAAAVDLVERAGSAIIGVSTHVDQLCGPASDAGARLRRFVTDMKARNLSAVLHGVNTAELVQAAADAGVTYMDGPAVADLTRLLKTRYRWNIG